MQNLQVRFHRALEKSRDLPGKVICRQLAYILDAEIISLCNSFLNEKDYFEKFCVIAIGGYGRMEISPHSDVDILYLHENLSEDFLSEIISRINTALFDSGKEVGHSCRTIQECFDSIDHSESFNAFLDSRFVTGSEKFYEKYVDEFLFCIPDQIIKFHSDQKIVFLEDRTLKGEEPIILSEPNIKNDPCGLRDIQAIYWLEKSEKKIPSLSGLGIIPVFTRGEVERLESAYDFFLRLRNALHVIGKRKTDRLELNYQPEIAEYLGFGHRAEISSFESLMKTLYRFQKEVYFFIGIYIDYKKSQRTLAVLQESQFESMTVYFREKYAYPPPHGNVFADLENLNQDVMLIFLACQKLDLEPSKLLLNEIKFASNFLEEDFKKSRSAIEIFLKILKSKKNVGKLLTLMHECEILGKFIPEFGACTHFALFSYHHQYTVDEHSLFIVRELDHIVMGKFEDENVLHEFQSISDFHILILAVLLHDAGKVKEGDHCQYGAELADAVGERLGLPAGEISLLKFLVRNHIEMSELSGKRDIADPKIIENFAKLVGTKERLRLLYVFTIIDIKSVGRGTLTNWKKEILNMLFLKTCEYLETEKVKSQEIKIEDDVVRLREFLEQKERYSPQASEIVARFAAQILPKTYLSYNTFRRVLQQYLNIDAMKKLKKISPVIESEKEPSFFTMTVYAEDYRFILSDISGAISSEGLNLIGMRSFKTKDGYTINQIQFTDSYGGGNISGEKIDRLKEKVKSVIQGQKNVEELIQSPSEWISFNTIPVGMIEEKVEFSNDLSDDYSILEIKMADSLGLLYRLLKVILSFDIQLHYVIVSTSADFAFDSFYLKSRDGNKIEDRLLLKNMVEEIKKSSLGSVSSRLTEIPF